jgi:hypothetical protein
MNESASLARLLRFLLGYGLAVSVIFYALPALAGQAEAMYESMSTVLRFGAVVLFATAVGGWYFLVQRRTQRE